MHDEQRRFDLVEEVLALDTGHLAAAQTLVDVFRRRVLRSRLPYIRFHDLRHSHAAHLIAAGQDALVFSKRPGHHSGAFTLDKYGHLMPEAGAGAARAVADLVDGPRVVTNL